MNWFLRLETNYYLKISSTNFHNVAFDILYISQGLWHSDDGSLWVMFEFGI